VGTVTGFRGVARVLGRGLIQISTKTTPNIETLTDTTAGITWYRICHRDTMRFKTRD